MARYRKRRSFKRRFKKKRIKSGYPFKVKRL